VDESIAQSGENDVDAEPKAGCEPVRKFPYYKLQHWETRISAWMDIQKSFTTRDLVVTYARHNLNPDTRVRIVIVEGYGSRRLLEDCGIMCEIDQEDEEK
jgi:hypothetical protein